MEGRTEPDRRVLHALIAVNILVFVAWSRVGPDGALFMRDHFTVSSESVLSGRVWTLLTSAFSHYDTNHMLFNGIAAWIFGDLVLRAWGAREVLVLYLAGALTSAMAHVAWDLFVGAPIPALGASGAVMALSVAAAWTAPNVRLLLFFLIPVPMWALVPLYVVSDLLGLVGVGGAGVANAAHLGGVVAGVAWVALMRRRLAPRPRARAQ
jgi:membrane associated rhomboid family serine protease